MRRNSAAGEFSGEMITFRWENIGTSTDRFIIKEDSIGIISYQNYSIYRLPSYRYFGNSILDGEGKLLNEETTTISGFKYFVHKNDDQFGLMLDSISAVSSSRKLAVDSVLVSQVFKNPEFFQLPNNIKLIGEVERGDTTRVTYAALEKAKSRRDTIALYYDRKTPDFRYSFSSSLNWKEMEPVRIKYVMNEYKEDGVTTPGVLAVFELKRMRIENQDELKRLLRVYEEQLNR